MKKKECEVCNGSGQVSFFKGESRFVVSWEDCPQCLGVGFQEVDAEQEGNEPKSDNGDEE